MNASLAVKVLRVTGNTIQTNDEVLVNHKLECVFPGWANHLCTRLNEGAAVSVALLLASFIVLRK